MMQIKRLRIANFRKFVQPVTINGFKPGLNVLAGDNEDGKSTVLHAIKSAFFTKYNTSATAAIQPYNSAAMPEVEIDFLLREGTYFLRKAFGRKGLAELRTPNGVFSGPDAELKLQELCQTGGVDRKETSSMWGVLWVEQGTTYLTPQLGELGKRTLSQALETEMGTVLGGENGQTLLVRLKELYGKWYTEKTAKDAKSSEYREAEELFREVSSRHEECAKTYQEYEETLRRLQEVREALKKHTTEKTLERACSELERTTQRQQAIAEKKLQFEKLEHQARAQCAEYTSLSEAFRIRQTLKSDLSNVEREKKNCAEKLAALELARLAASTAFLSKQKELAEVEVGYEEISARLSTQETCEQLWRAQLECSQMEQKLSQAKITFARGKSLNQQIADIKVDAATLSKLQTLQTQALQAAARLDAVSTRLEFYPNDGRKLSISGQPADPDQPMLLTEIATLDLDGWGRIKVCPGGSDLEKIKSNASQLQQNLKDMLNSLSIDSVADAVQLERRRAELAADCKSLAREFEKMAPGGLAALNADFEKAKAALTQLEASLTDAQRIAMKQLSSIISRLDGDSDAPSDQPGYGADSNRADDEGVQPEFPIARLVWQLEKLSLSLKELRRQRDELRQRHQQIKVEFQKADQLFRQTEIDQQKTAAELQNLERDIVQNTEKLATERLRETDEVLERRLTEARVLHEGTKKEKEALEQQLNQLNAVSIEQEIEAGKQAIKQIEADINQLAGDERELLGALQTFGNTGITEELARLKGKLEQAAMQVERSRHKARAIKLLWETVCAAEREAKEELSAPLMRHLEPYVTEVFKDGRIAVNNGNFSITELHRSGINEEYDKLSLGTREQLSILTRLAFAQLLVESNQPALVILDDALVYSDQGRLERMQEVLLQASERYQIIMLTCRERDYAHLDANLIRLEDCADVSDLTTTARHRSQNETLAVPIGQLTAS